MGARTERQLKAGLEAEIARLEAEVNQLAATYQRLPIELARRTGKIEALRWTLDGFNPPTPAPDPAPPPERHPDGDPVPTPDPTAG